VTRARGSVTPPDHGRRPRGGLLCTTLQLQLVRLWDQQIDWLLAQNRIVASDIYIERLFATRMRAILL
jgi:hypothetical protein